MSNRVHADATYKLVWQGMPVLIIGTSDMDRHFHPFGICASTNEKQEDFEFLFKSVYDAIQKLGEIFRPNVLISDASNAIRNAFTKTFGFDTILIMCWAHMRRNVTQNLCMVDPEFKEDIMDDIDCLQLSSNKDIFDKAVSLFIKKWVKKKQNAFVEYMQKMWFSSHQNWYEGVSNKSPSTNNALESFNAVIKKEETIRERLPLARFLQLCLDSTEKWSKQYAMNDKAYINIPTINLKRWTESYQWAKSNKVITYKLLDNSIEYYCPAGEEIKISQNQIINAKKMIWDSFEQYKKRSLCVWFVHLPKEANNWQEGNCTCPRFLKEYMCKHVIGMAIRLKYVTTPPAAKQIPIGEKRKRGRPKKPSRALIVD